MLNRNIIIKTYYTIWTDCIKKMQSVPRNRNYWKFYSISIISTIMSINLLFLSAILPNKMMADYLNFIKLNIFKGNTFDTLFNGLILIVPMILINYFLIFRKNRYLTFIDKYQFHNGKYCLKYMLISLWGPVFVLAIGMIYIKFI